MIAWVLGVLLLIATLDACAQRAMARAYERELERVRRQLQDERASRYADLGRGT